MRRARASPAAWARPWSAVRSRVAFVATTASVVLRPAAAVGVPASRAPNGVPPPARCERASTYAPSGPRAPARIFPEASTTLPTAFTTTNAPTTMSPPVAAHVPTPPFIAARGPSAFPTVAPVPAPTLPSATSLDAAVQARYASSAMGQRPALPPGARSKSKITAVGTIGTMPADPTGRPRPRSLSQRITPSAAPSPKAEPPVSRTASMRSTTWRGFSASSSRVPVARPRTAQAARIPLSGPSTTLQPVARSRSVQCPTEIPRTAVRLAGAEDAMGARRIARLARVVEGTYVSAMPNPDPQSPPTTVLVVDDEDGIRQALDRFLTRLGYRVLQAASGAEALDRQGAEQPQVLLSDLRLPNMSGAELVPKALAADSDLAIIMLTAIDEPRTAIECLKLGAYEYLIKPVDLDELELSLQGALRQRQLEVERRELEQWLAREVAVRTRDLEEHTTAIGQVALDALAATKSWSGERQAVEKLAEALGRPGSLAQVRGQVLDANRRRALGHDEGALLHVAHLPHVAGPRRREQAIECFRGAALRAPRELGVQRGEEPRHQRQAILARALA